MPGRAAISHNFCLPRRHGRGCFRWHEHVQAHRGGSEATCSPRNWSRRRRRRSGRREASSTAAVEASASPPAGGGGHGFPTKEIAIATVVAELEHLRRRRRRLRRGAPTTLPGPPSRRPRTRAPRGGSRSSLGLATHRPNDPHTQTRFANTHHCLDGPPPDPPCIATFPSRRFTHEAMEHQQKRSRRSRKRKRQRHNNEDMQTPTSRPTDGE